MENNEFERFSKAWNAADSNSSSQKIYSEKEIKDIKMKKSLDFSRSINDSIVFDYVLKSILIAGMLLLVLFYKSDTSLLLVLCGLIGFSVFLLFKEVNIRTELIKIEDYTQELGSVLKYKIKFYKKHFPALKVMLAFTNSLLVWVGSMFYSYAKYERYRIDDLTDVLVAFLMVSLAFGISYYALSYQFRLNVLDLEESLMNLDDQESASIKIEAQQRRKKKFRAAMIIAIIAGVALFLFLLISYLKFN